MTLVRLISRLYLQRQIPFPNEIKLTIPTDTFTIWEIRGSTDFQALKLRKGRSGYIRRYPTCPFIIQEPHDREISEIYEAQQRRTTDLEAPRL